MNPMMPLCKILILGLVLGGCATTSPGKSGEQDGAAAPDPSARIVQLQKQLEQSPGDPTLHFSLGNAWFDAGRNAEAFDAYQQALTLNPRFAEAYTNLGLALRRLGREAAAMGAYEYALDLKPGDETTLENMKLLAESMGDVARFQRAVEELAVIRPRDVLIQGQLADTWFQLERYEDAIPIYEKLLLLEAAEPMNYYRLGMCHYSLGRLEQAATVWRQGLRQSPDHPGMLQAIAVLLWDMKDYDGAWAAVGECESHGIILDPEFISALQQASGRSQ